MSKEYYVYIYFDPRNKGSYNYEGLDYGFLYEPFYVGKGTGKRYMDHLQTWYIKKEKNKFKKGRFESLIKEKIKPFVEIIKYFNDEYVAYLYEDLIIKSIGRQCFHTGPLCNLDDSGYTIEGKVSHKSAIWTNKRRRNKSESQIGNKNPMFGKTFYQVWIEKHGKTIADQKLKEHCKKKSENAKKGNWFTNQKEKTLLEQITEKYGDEYAQEWDKKRSEKWKQAQIKVHAERKKKGMLTKSVLRTKIQKESITIEKIATLLLQKKELLQILKDLNVSINSFNIFLKENNLKFRDLKKKYFYGK